MHRRSDARLSLCTFAVLGVCTALPALAGPVPSLCLVADEGCLAPGGIQVRVILGASDTVIYGGQFTVEYDPSTLSLIDAAPGRACDPTSPFAVEVLQDDDHSSGEVRCAVGVNFLKGAPPSGVPLTLACLSFAPVGNAMDPSTLCLTEGEHPFETELVDHMGHSVAINNSAACPAGSPSPILSCDDVMPGANCDCTPASADCHGLDTPCRTGVCNPMTARCELMFVNEGGPCDDDDSCTTVDRCHEGACTGSGCTNSSLCASSTSCFGLDPLLTIEIRLTEGDRVINGAQFSFEYDPTELDLLNVSPGATCDDSPFASELAEVVDEVAGEVFYAVGVEIGGAPGTTGPATLACLTFAHLGEPGVDVCLFDGANPFLTTLVDEFGQSVPIGDPDVCPSSNVPPTPRCAELTGCNIPTVSEWGLGILTLLLLTGAKIYYGYPRSGGVRSFAPGSRG